ncbi:hypothetical protein QBC37DRAFT_333778 [Rhypophila decipiens]|uniref:Uncharacterized protein n=1 Tax=Rhypophila decipiens TaxID=261697 RepID=A0AAN6YHA5_9PEZI|nr:hypothetical protein QBC37DRAFT_333778 [Rhypophila decipiens]
MASTPRKAVWFAAAAKKSLGGTLYIRCIVKPGASKAREGVTSVDDEAVEVCVSARAQEGEANKAVVKLFSEVLNVPKSDLQITQGLKSRNKTIALAVNVSEEECLHRVQASLKEATSEF